MSDDKLSGKLSGSDISQAKRGAVRVKNLEAIVTSDGDLVVAGTYQYRVSGSGDAAALKSLAIAGLIRAEKLHYSYSITEEGILYLETERAKYKRTIANGGPAGSEAP